MKEYDLKIRTAAFGLDVIKLVESLPRTRTADVIGRQLLRCATSVGANYRAACRARSRPDFVAKLAIVEEEADESTYWMEMLVKSGTIPESKLKPLIEESEQLVAIIVSSIKTSKSAASRATDTIPKSKIQNLK